MLHLHYEFQNKLNLKKDTFLEQKTKLKVFSIINVVRFIFSLLNNCKNNSIKENELFSINY